VEIGKETKQKRVVAIAVKEKWLLERLTGEFFGEEGEKRSNSSIAIE